MKKIKLDIDYKTKSNDGAKELTLSYLEGGVNLTHKQGLEGQKRRMWGRIQRKMDDLRDDKKLNELELEDTEFDFVWQAFKQAHFPPNISILLNILEDYLEGLDKEEVKK